MEYFYGYVKQFLETYMRIPEIRITDVIEIIILAVIIYELLVWFKNTRAWSLIKGLILVVLCVIVAYFCGFTTILWIANKVFSVAIIAFVVIFQPELRRALEQIGTNHVFPFLGKGDGLEKNRLREEVIDQLVRACAELGKAKTGALIVIEKNILLNDFIATGIEVDGVITAELLINIFEHNTPLHDGAVIIRQNRIVAATCYLPISDNMEISKELGTRHRAGLGISEVSDALTIIVSEETGKVSLTKDGGLRHGVDAGALRGALTELMEKEEEEKVRKFALKKGRRKHEEKIDK